MSARVPLAKAALRAGRWLRSRARPGIPILGYHRIAEDGPDPFGIALAPATLAAHLDAICALAVPMRLHDAAAALARADVPPRAVVVTFDDGYADTLHRALPLLEHAGVPATVFVTAGSPGAPFWWDRLTDILHARPIPRTLELEVRGRKHVWRTEDPAATVRAVARALRTLPAGERDHRIERIAEWADAPGERAATGTALTTEELCALAASNRIEIGAHGMSHSPLAGRPASELDTELRTARARLEALLHREVRSLAWPDGAFTEDTIAHARAAGYTIGCASVVDVARPDSEALALPRFWPRHPDARAFARWLRRWLHG